MLDESTMVFVLVTRALKHSSVDVNPPMVTVDNYCDSLEKTIEFFNGCKATEIEYPRIPYKAPGVFKTCYTYFSYSSDLKYLVVFYRPKFPDVLYYIRGENRLYKYVSDITKLEPEDTTSIKAFGKKVETAIDNANGTARIREDIDKNFAALTSQIALNNEEIRAETQLGLTQVRQEAAVSLNNTRIKLTTMIQILGVLTAIGAAFIAGNQLTLTQGLQEIQISTTTQMIKLKNWTELELQILKNRLFQLEVQNTHERLRELEDQNAHGRLSKLEEQNNGIVVYINEAVKNATKQLSGSNGTVVFVTTPDNTTKTLAVKEDSKKSEINVAEQENSSLGKFVKDIFARIYYMITIFIGFLVATVGVVIVLHLIWHLADYLENLL